MESLSNVVGINRRSVFNLEEARALLPIVFRLTKSYSERVQALIHKLDQASLSTSSEGQDSILADALEAEAGRLIQEWQAKIQKLGGVPKGLWLADFDSGDGYYCWKYPERNIEYWHAYRDGYSKRVRLSSVEFRASIEVQDHQRGAGTHSQLDGRL